MSIKFHKLKDPKLNLTDTLTFGKFQNCRVCDILEDNYEYVLWVHSKMNNFAASVIEECHQFKLAQPVLEEEANNKAILNMNPWNHDDSWDDDIPF